MHWRNTASRYGFIAGSLHWVIVAGIVAQYFLAEAAEDSEGASAGAIGAMDVHSSLGITILALALLRLVWRLIDPPPAWPTTMKRYEVLLARTAHILFYALLFAIPLSGWALSSAEGDSLRYFGLFDLPALTPGSGESAEELLEEVHEVLFNTLLGVALLHIAAALRHWYVDRDNPRGMLPRRD